MRSTRFLLPAGLCASIIFTVGCARKPSGPTLTVLLRMMPAQQRFFAEEIVSPFEKKHGCKIDLVSFENGKDIERFLLLEKSKKHPQIGLVKTPFEMTRTLVAADFLKPLSEIVDSATLENDLAEYHQLALGLGFVEGKYYYIPRKLETRLLFYRKSKVADAVGKFNVHRDRINRELKAQNGKGLPADYALEDDPDLWDFYDLYVVGSIWAAEEYNGIKMGRMAHRGAPYLGTTLFLVDRAFQLGASNKEIMNLADKSVARMLQWERVFVRNGIYNPGMWQDPWRGANIYNGIKDGKVFCAYLQQIDCFLVHGWPDDPAMPTYLPEEDDMGLALVPQAVSFDLNGVKKPSYEGTRKISTGGWWWGIPQSSPDPELAYAFARHITSMESQAKECSRFGMIPVRKDILLNLPQVFEEGWVGEIYQKSIEQMRENELTTVSYISKYARIGQHLVDIWEKIAVEAKTNGVQDISLSAIMKRLRSEFVGKQREILGTDYPQ